MSTDTLFHIALAALLLCWAVGAHNRLVRLKNAVGKEYAQIDAQLRQRQDLIAQVLAFGERLDGDLLAALADARRPVLAAMESARQRPSGGSEAASLNQAEHRLDEQLAAVWQSPVTHELAAGDPELRQLVLDLAHLEGRLDLVAEPYHQAVSAFNEAVQEFPAWLMAKLSGLKPLPGLHLGGHDAARQAARPLMVGRRETDLPPELPA